MNACDQGQKTCLEVRCHPKPEAHVDTETDALVLEPLPPRHREWMLQRS